MENTNEVKPKRGRASNVDVLEELKKMRAEVAELQKQKESDSEKIRKLQRQQAEERNKFDTLKEAVAPTDYFKTTVPVKEATDKQHMKYLADPLVRKYLKELFALVPRKYKKSGKARRATLINMLSDQLINILLEDQLSRGITNHRKWKFKGSSFMGFDNTKPTVDDWIEIRLGHPGILYAGIKNRLAYDKIVDIVHKVKFSAFELE